MESLKASAHEKLRLSVFLVLDVQESKLFLEENLCRAGSLSAVPVPFGCAVEQAGSSTSSRLAADPERTALDLDWT